MLYSGMAQSAVRLTTGQTSWIRGVDSNVPPTIAGPENPDGLKPNQLAWGNNITVRGGGITPRRGWVRLTAFEQGVGIFQEAFMYAPSNAFPYIMAQIGGRTFQVNVGTDNSIVEKTIAGDPNSALLTKSWMVQGEQFLVIQDGTAVPLVWDGNILQRVTSMANANPKIPTGEAMAYYMGRIWIAKGREYLAGDIVRGPSGTAPYSLNDSILSMTENTYLSLGGTFLVPTLAGNIRALSFPANLNTSLGEGQLLVFTREQIYSVNVVPQRAAWATLTEPIQRVAQINFGTTSDRSVVQVNGDLFCQSTDGIRSITQALRYFDQWGNLAISSEESRAVDLNDRALLLYGSGIYFDNRLLQTCLPYQTDVGVAHQALLSLDFDLISTLSERMPPAWEGVNEGLAILRVLQGDFGGRQRAFALVRGSTGAIEVWELTSTDLFDTNASGEARITYQFETPSFTWGKPFMLKELDTVELWIDQLRGTVDFTLEFRPDQHPCWQYWHKWQECAPRNNCEDPGVLLPCPYPTQTYRQQYRSLMVMPKPPIAPCQDYIPRPMNIGFGFQFRLTVHGYCRIRGLLAHAFERERQPYDGIRC